MFSIRYELNLYMKCKTNCCLHCGNGVCVCMRVRACGVCAYVRVRVCVCMCVSG